MELVLAFVIFLVVAFFALKLKSQGASTKNEHLYKKNDALFTPAERSFLGVLGQATSDKIKIFGKVRVADVISPAKGMNRSEWQKAFNKISAKHFDFVLCDKDDLSILCVIELNDSSHQKKNRTERDAFLVNACKSADVKLIQIPAQASYNIVELRNFISEFLDTNQTEIISTIEKKQHSEAEERSIEKEAQKGNGVELIINCCSKCGSKMIRKKAAKGKNIGKEFWACSSFPKCRHIVPINT